MSHKWDGVKEKIKSKYPKVQDLSFWDQFHIFLHPVETQCEESLTDGRNFVSISYITVLYKGREYFKRFGKL